MANFIHSQSCYEPLEKPKKIKWEFWKELKLGIMAVTRESCLPTSAPITFSSSSAGEMCLSD